MRVTICDFCDQRILDDQIVSQLLLSENEEEWGAETEEEKQLRDRLRLEAERLCQPCAEATHAALIEIKEEIQKGRPK